ncbi:2Fe-2S iron-sulfur cluster-binding protein [Pseudalkalibacillus sp. A8]|uniref:2Fe-2S iron-sulfur cluster-binding protein n=1 Tax=Pseudalkalibacillus sp. A8 TaxID=3382641 RepID=UPI0038B64EB6
MKKALTVGSLKEDSATLKKTSHGKFQAKKSSGIDIEQNKPTNITNIYLIQKGRAYSVKPEQNMTLLDSALKQGNRLDFKCKKGTCGRCKVLVLKGGSFLIEPNDQEKAKFDGQVDQGFRLACQTQFN